MHAKARIRTICVHTRTAKQHMEAASAGCVCAEDKRHPCGLTHIVIGDGGNRVSGILKSPSLLVSR